MKILITGGCGFIGTNLISYISKHENIEIRVIDNEILGSYNNIKKWDVEFEHGDINSEITLNKVLQGVDAVIHLAADTRVIDSIENPDKNFQTNVIGTFTLLRNMQKFGIDRIINASTGGAILGEVKPPVREDMLPSPQSPYGASKLAVEGYLSAFSASYGMKACSLRFSNVYGPNSWHKGSVVAQFLRCILNGEKLNIYGDGEQTRDYVYVDDLCNGIVKALKSEVSGVYQLGTGNPTSIKQLIKIICRVTNKNPEIIYHQRRTGELLHTWCDISKARSTFGYSPAMDLDHGIEETWKWFCDYRNCS